MYDVPLPENELRGSSRPIGLVAVCGVRLSSCAAVINSEYTKALHNPVAPTNYCPSAWATLYRYFSNS